MNCAWTNPAAPVMLRRTSSDTSLARELARGRTSSESAAETVDAASRGTFKKLIKTHSSVPSWDGLSRGALVKELQLVVPKLSAEGLSLVLGSLSTLKLPTRNKEMLLLSDLLVERLHHWSRVMSAGELTLSLLGLARLGIKVPNLRASGSNSFFNAVPRAVAEMSPGQVADTMWALGKIGAQWDGFSLRTQQAISSAVIRTTASMTPLHVANTIHGLSNQRAQWSALPTALLTSLKAGLLRTVNGMGEQEVSVCISGLGRLGAYWGSLSVPTREQLGRRFLENIHSLNAQGLAMSIHGLGRMDADMGSLPVGLRDSLMSAIVDIAPDLNALEVSNILYGLGRMGTDYCCCGSARPSGLSRRARSGLMTAFLRELWQMNAQGISNSLWGMMLMKAQWRVLSKELQHVLLQAITREAHHMDEQEVANTLYSLGCMGVQWKDHVSIDCSTKEHLLQSLESALEDGERMPTSGVVVSLLGLSKLQISWYALPPSLQACLSSAVARVLRNASDRTISTCIHALGGLGMRWDALGPVLQTGIQESISRSHWELTGTGTGISSSIGGGAVPPNPNPLANSTATLPHQFQPRDLPQSLLLFDLPPQAAAELLLSSPFDSVLSSVDQLLPFGSKPSAGTIKIIDGDTGLDVLTELLHHEMIPNDSLLHAKPTAISMVPMVRKGARYVHAVSSQPVFARAWPPPVGSSLPVSSSPSVDRVGGDPSSRPIRTADSTSDKGHYVISLAKLEVPWDALGVSAKISLLTSLSVALPSLSEQGVVNSLRALSDMGATWLHLSISPTIRSALLAAITRVAPSMREQGVSMTFLALAKMDVCYRGEELNDEVRLALRRAIVRQSEIGEQALSNLLYGLGKLKCKWMDLHPDVRYVLTAAIVVCQLRSKCSALGVANSLFGLAHMHVEWSGLSSSVRLSLLKEVSRTLPSASASQLCSMLSSLSKLAVAWSSIPEYVQHSIMLRVLKVCPSMNEQHISTILFALGSMHAKWEQLPVALTDCLLDSILRVNASKGGSKGGSSAAHHLSTGTLKARVNSFTKSVSSDQQYATDELGLPDSSNGRPTAAKHAQGIAMTVVGLARLEASWVILPHGMTKAFELSLIAYTPQMNSVQLSNTLYGLAGGAWRWDMFSEQLKHQFITAIAGTLMRSGKYQDISMCISALGSLGLCWESVSRRSIPFVRSFTKAITSVLSNGTVTEIAGVIFGMGLMECSWEQLPPSCRRDIIRSILTAFCLSETMSPPKNQPFMTKGTETAAADDDDDDDGKSAFDSYNGALSSRSQALSNIIYGLSLMVFDTESRQLTADLTPVHIALLDAVSDMGVLKFSDIEKEQILIYIHLLHTVLPASEVSLIDAHCPKHIIRADATNNVPSKLQESVISALTSALRRRNHALEVANEYSAFSGVFPVDATVFEGELPVAFVEVDGPHHFHFSAAEGRAKLRRKDIMKETLYRRKHPTATFIRVRYDQVDHFGSKYVGSEIADFITISKYVSQPSVLQRSPTSGSLSPATGDRRAATDLRRQGAASLSSSYRFEPTLTSMGEQGCRAREALRQLHAALECSSDAATVSSSAHTVTARTRTLDNILAEFEEDNS